MHNAPMLEFRDTGTSATQIAVMSGEVVIASLYKRSEYPFKSPFGCAAIVSRQRGLPKHDGMAPKPPPDFRDCGDSIAIDFFCLCDRVGSRTETSDGASFRWSGFQTLE
jgi:hypothetical protein